MLVLARVGIVAVHVGGSRFEAELLVQPIGRLATGTRRQVDGLGAKPVRPFQRRSVEGFAGILLAFSAIRGGMAPASRPPLAFVASIGRF